MILLSSQEWGRVENNTCNKISKPKRIVGKGWVELDCKYVWDNIYTKDVVAYARKVIYMHYAVYTANVIAY